jgi:transcriptional regulator with XRE-family HTH domain
MGGWRMVIDYNVIGQRIRTVRKRKGYTQEKLAENLDVSTVYVSQIENGKTKLSLEMLIKIAALLDTDPGFFISGSVVNKKDLVPHDISVVLQKSSPQKIKLITEIVKVLDKY